LAHHGPDLKFVRSIRLTFWWGRNFTTRLNSPRD